MNFKYSGLLFVLTVILEAINGLALDHTSIAQNHTQDLPKVNSTIEKSQTSTAKNGPVIVSNSPVTVIVANASEILPKSNSVSDDHQTTTSAPVPSTPAVPIPAPDLGRWVIKNGNNSVCIIAQMAMQLNITYPGQNDKNQNATINIPGKNSTANGNCSTPQSIKINWGPGHSLQVNFGINKTAKNFFISELSLEVNATVLKNIKENITWLSYVNNSSEFKTPLDMSYKCSKVQNVELESENPPNLKAVLSIKDTQFEAYMNKTKDEFGAAQDCDVFDTPDIVPVAVGTALAILVVIVLVAYLIGRKRSHNRGYLSM